METKTSLNDGIAVFAGRFAIGDTMRVQAIDACIASMLMGQHGTDSIGLKKTTQLLRDSVGCKSTDEKGATVYNSDMYTLIGCADKITKLLVPVVGVAVIATMTFEDLLARVELFRASNDITKVSHYKAKANGDKAQANGSEALSVGKAMLNRLNSKGSEVTDSELSALLDKINAMVASRASAAAELVQAAELAQQAIDEHNQAAIDAENDAAELAEYRALKAKKSAKG